MLASDTGGGSEDHVVVEELAEALDLVGVLRVEVFLSEDLEQLLRDETRVGQFVSVAHVTTRQTDSVFVGGLEQTQLTSVGHSPLRVEQVVAGTVVGLEGLLLADGDVLFGVTFVLGLLGENGMVERQRAESADIFAGETTAAITEIKDMMSACSIKSWER